MQVEEEMVPKGLQSTIRLKGTAQRQDSARFQCLARNDFGSNKTDINFVVQVHINNLFLEMRFPWPGGIDSSMTTLLEHSVAPANTIQIFAKKCVRSNSFLIELLSSVESTKIRNSESLN